METFYQEKIDILKSEGTDYDGLIYIFYSYDADDNFKIIYAGITRKYGKEVKCKCGFKANASKFSPDIIEVTELKTETKHRAVFTCPECKEQKTATISVNRNLTNPLFFGRLGYESARHMGQITDAYLCSLGQLKEDELSWSRKSSLKTKIKWIEDFFGKNPSCPPKLIKPVYFSAVLWKEKRIPRLNNISINMNHLERILQDIGKLVNPNMLNNELIKLSKSKSLVKTYHKIVRLIEKLYGNLSVISTGYLEKSEPQVFQDINGLARKSKQLNKSFRKWSKLENKNKKVVNSIVS